MTTLQLELPGDCATNLFTVVAPGLVSSPQCGPGAGHASLEVRGPASVALVLLISQQGARWRLRYPKIDLPLLFLIFLTTKYFRVEQEECGPVDEVVTTSEPPITTTINDQQQQDSTTETDEVETTTETESGNSENWILDVKTYEKIVTDSFAALSLVCGRSRGPRRLRPRRSPGLPLLHSVSMQRFLKAEIRRRKAAAERKSLARDGIVSNAIMQNIRDKPTL